MSRRFDWICLNPLLDRVAIPYPIVFLLIGLLLFLIYILTLKISGREPNFSGYIYFTKMSYMIAYQLIGIRYILNILKTDLDDLSHLSADTSRNFYINLGRKVYESSLYYIFLIIVVLPFYVIDWLPLNYNIQSNFTLIDQFLPTYSKSLNLNVIPFDIFNDLMGFAALFLLASILWIMANITWVFINASKNIQNLSMEISVLRIENKLRSIKDSILNVLIYYFICISLILLSYGGLMKYLPEIQIIMIFLLIGTLFFYIGFGAINKVLKDRVNFEQDKINDLHQKYLQIFINRTLISNEVDKSKETEQISSILEILQKQRDILGQVNIRAYDLKSVISFFATLILPIMTDFVQKNIEFGKFYTILADPAISFFNSIFNF